MVQARSMKPRINRSVWGWALYDWANSAFATTVVAAFFPIFFKKYWAADLSATQSTFYLGSTLSAVALVFALAAPILGSFADLYGYAKKGLLIFAFFGVIGCGLLFLVPEKQWAWALATYAMAYIGFVGANLFYDSLLVSVTEEKHFNWVSCFGYALGYLGGGVLIVLNAMMVTKPDLFGFVSAAEGAKWAFLSVSLWWFLFTIPLWLWVPAPSPVTGRPSALQGFEEVLKTLQEVRRHKVILLFLLSYFFYIDGVHTIFVMAVDLALSIGLESQDLIKAIIIVQFVGFPAAFAFSYLAKKIGTKNGIMAGIVIYSFVCVFGAQVTTASEFYGIAIVLGCVQGGVQALSRSFYASLIPQEKSAEFFGFYNMLGKFSAILGPFLVGLTGLVTNNSRASLFAILILFIVGGLLLRKVPTKRESLPL